MLAGNRASDEKMNGLSASALFNYLRGDPARLRAQSSIFEFNGVLLLHFSRLAYHVGINLNFALL